MAIQLSGGGATGNGLQTSTNLPNRSPLSWSFWFKWAALPAANQHLYTHITSDYSSNYVTVSIDNSVSPTTLIIASASGGTPASNTTWLTGLTTGVWRYFAFSNQTGASNFNGYMSAADSNAWTNTGSTTGGGAGTANFMALGSDSGSALSAFNGVMAGFKMWSAVLTSAELLNEKYTLRPQRTANLVRWCPFIDTGANDFINYAGNGFAWTENGTVTVNTDNPPISWGASARRIFLPSAAGVSVTPTGVSSTAGIGTLAATGGALTTPTGVASTTGLGTLGLLLWQSHWPFEDVATDAVGSWDLTAVNAPGYVAGGAPNKDRAARLIAASDQLFWFNDDLTGRDAVTISLWIYPTAEQTRSPISVSFDNNDALEDEQFRITVVSDGRLGLILRTGATTESWTTTITTEEVDFNEWNFIAVVYDGSATNVKLYVDKSAAFNTLETYLDETTAGGTLSQPAGGAGDLAIGSYHNAAGGWNTTNDFEGRIDDVRIYNTALTSAQVTAIRDDNQGTQGITQEFGGLAATGQIGTISSLGGALTTPAGVAATGQIGTPAVSGAALLTLVGLAATGQIGTVTVVTASGVAVTLSGVSSASGIGTMTATGAATIVLGGVSSTTAIGVLTAIGAANITLDGNSATGQIGTVSALGAALLTLTDVVATGQVGTVTVIVAGGVAVTLTGVSSSTGIGTATATGGASLTLAGVNTTTAIGTLQALGASDITLTGVAATGQLGTPGAIGAALLTLADVAATGQIGNVTVVVAGGVSVTLSGVASTSAIGTMTGQGGALLTLPGVSATGSPGDLTAVISQLVTLAGVSATAQVGVMTEVTGALLTLQGVLATGQVGSVTIPLPADQAGELIGTITITAALASDADEAITVTPSITGIPTLH